MKDETKFWKRLAITLGLILIVIIGTSSYYSSDLSDVCNELESIVSELSDIEYELSRIRSRL